MSSTKPVRLAFTIQEAATALAVSRWTIHRLIVNGQLRSVKIGRARRIPAVELERLLDRAR